MAKPERFILKYVIQILDHLEARIMRSLAMRDSNDDPLDCVPNKYKKSIHIRSKKAAKYLPVHKPYDHAIDPKTA
jgi:hypothetical protein